MYIFYLLIFLLPLLALRRRNEDSGSVLDSKSTTCIKGILCIYVMLHNLGLDLDNPPFKEQICEYSGGIGVGLFFFLSAYGIIRAYQAKGNKYLLRLIFIHIPKIWLVAVFINALTYFSFMQGSLEPTDAWMRILNLDLFNNFNRINRHGWYVATIIALYLAFAVVYFGCSKLKSEKKWVIAGAIMAILAVALRLTAKFTDVGGMYTRELPAFAIGCIYATFYDKINALASRYFTLGMILSGIAFCIGVVFVEPVATYAAALIIILISQRYTYYSGATFFLGKICIGVYLFLHYSSIVLQPFLSHEYLWVLLNAGFILLIATAIYAVQYAVEYVTRKSVGYFMRRKTQKDRSALDNNA